MSKGNKVQVFVRTKPTARFAYDMIEIQKNNSQHVINIYGTKNDKHGIVNNKIIDWSFSLDGILHFSSQDEVFEKIGTGLIDKLLKGYNGTLLCYGQTGAGKTFTITGATENYNQRGLIPRSIQLLFKEIDKNQDIAFTVRISYVQIYNEIMTDLLNTQPNNNATHLAVSEDFDGICVKGLSQHVVYTEEEALNWLFEGETNRAIASHTLNRNSSRSHCVFTIHIEARSRLRSDVRYVSSKLNFVDLAGSERLKKTKSEGKVQTEAMYINKSLSFLEQAIIALADRKRDHVPYRQSKLTHFLKDSIGGNCATILIANIWPEADFIEETVSTLRFSSRMMCVDSEPLINEHIDPLMMIKKLEEEIIQLKQELKMHDTLANRSRITYEPLSEQQKRFVKEKVALYLKGEIDELDIINLRQIQTTFECFREIYSTLHNDIKNDYHERFVLLDRKDVNAVANAQKAGILPEDVDISHLVGEADRASFGIGVAPKASASDSKAFRDQKRRERQKKKGSSSTSISPGTAAERASVSPSPMKSAQIEETTGATPEKKKSEVDESPKLKSHSQKQIIGDNEPKLDSVATKKMEPDLASQLSDTLPPKQQAFEEFKAGKGREINQILIDNKELLVVKKKSFTNTARHINNIKKSIDDTKQELEKQANLRENEGYSYTDEGEAIISEEEFNCLQKLQTLKQEYRHHAETYENLKSEIAYCQRLVDQCRIKLVTEFDKWYLECYGADNTEEDGFQNTLSALKNLDVQKHTNNFDEIFEDELEKYERLQRNVFLNEPDSYPFNKANNQFTAKKVYEKAMNQSQPAFKKSC